MALKDLLGGIFEKAAETGLKIADEFTLSKEEKEQFRQQDEDRLAKLQAAVMDQVTARFNQVRDVIVAEMTQGDSYTKRARPTIVYSGILMHFVAMIGKGFGYNFEIPPDFTYVWGGVCGVWIVGRSWEKVGTPNKLTEAVTGSSSLPSL